MVSSVSLHRKRLSPRCQGEGPSEVIQCPRIPGTRARSGINRRRAEASGVGLLTFPVLGSTRERDIRTSVAMLASTHAPL
ncbi:Protein of unknown function [Micromonospora lupini str. Lupac 08]|uniref:Uncharacterized protein n=1 Tax=Micromonospora lupini str. Lupac 08 TaxID=1150864 RepID=I0LD44_9ACTN|nr:Protein of unknown function [Micromonospora lupini str. Lupac 08]